MKRRVLAGIISGILLSGAISVYFYLQSVDDNGDDVVPDEGWRTETVDDDGWVGIDPAIAVDSQGNPHISYYDQGNRDLKYAHWDGSSWQVETVDSEGDVGEASGIAVDEEGNPHICYIDETTGALKYAKVVENSWEVEIVDQPALGFQVMSTSIVLDSEDRPHIAYNVPVEEDKNGGEGADTTKYARLSAQAGWDGSSWVVETVTTSGSDVQIALDVEDSPHLAFKKKDRINYAQKVSGEWGIAILDPSTEAGGDVGIDLDSKGRPHVVYNDYGNAAIMYVGWDGDSWNIQTVASGVGVGEGLRIAVDRNDDRPHVIYADCESEKLMYAVLEAGSWSKETVYCMGICSLAIDRSGRVHVAHNKSADGNPKDYLPDYTGPDTEIEILEYSVRE